MKSRFEVTKEELTELYQFQSCEKIGKQYGVCAEIVRRKLHEFGIATMKRGGRRSFDPAKEVLEALYQDKTMLEIANHFGVGETVVFKRLKEHGIEQKEHINHRLKVGRVFSDTHKQNIRKSLIARVAYGDKNPNWKGGLTIKNLQARNSWEAREWKKNSLIRADHKCENCGVEDNSMCNCCGVKVKLHVHHIHSFAKFVELRFDPTNSKILCPKCHNTEHQMKIA